MKKMEIINCSEILAEIISSKYLSSIPQRKPYYHMGATIIDSILQAGMNYQYVVYPRVNKLLQDFPNYTTTCDFIILMQVVPLFDLINWKNKNKLYLIEQLAWLFIIIKSKMKII
jgi:hypothetical protein